MIDFTVRERIDRPAEEVFAYATDPACLATWQTNTVSAVREDDGPLAVGSRIREVHRGPGGKEMASLVEVAEYAPHERFALRMIEGPLPLHAELTFTPADGGATELHFRGFGQVTGAQRVIQPLLARVLRRQFAAHCATLRRVLEERATSSNRDAPPTGRLGGA